LLLFVGAGALIHMAACGRLGEPPRKIEAGEDVRLHRGKRVYEMNGGWVGFMPPKTINRFYSEEETWARLMAEAATSDAVKFFKSALEKIFVDSGNDVDLKEAALKCFAVVDKYTNIWERRKSGKTLERLENLRRVLNLIATKKDGINLFFGAQVTAIIVNNSVTFKDAMYAIVNPRVATRHNVPPDDLIADRHLFQNNFKKLVQASEKALNEIKGEENIKQLIAGLNLQGKQKKEDILKALAVIKQEQDNVNVENVDLTADD